ncbi:MAG: serine hydrolase domain-containing protein [Acidobacteriota bacterium]
MPRALPVVVVLLATLVGGPRPLSAQSLDPSAAPSLEISLFERYLEALRVQAGIPGLSAAIVQRGRLIWEGGFGLRDVERSLPATPDTPYPIANLTETFAAVLMMQCVQNGLADLDDPIGRWAAAPDASVTLRALLSHTSDPGVGGFRYDPARYAWLTPAIDRCDGTANARVRVTEDILDRLGMVDAVPGLDVSDPASPVQQIFDEKQISKYAAVLQRLAVPYVVDRRGRATRSEYPAPRIDASTGLVASVRDLARFASALDDAVLLGADTQALMWTPRALASAPGVALTAAAPMGLGWFVQTSGGERLVWHFGQLPGAASGLLLRVPSKGLTFIMLANSDDLSAPFALTEGDVTASVFARLFLRLFP